MKTSVALTRLVIFFLLCVCVCVMFGCGGPPPPQPPTPPPPEPKVAPLRLTEVLPYPVEGESPWIELYNAEDTVVNPGGQRISIGNSLDYTLSDSLIVPRNGYVLLVFDSTREGRDSATSRGDTIQVFYLGPEYAGAMDNRPGFITSYKPKVIADSLDTVVDLVAWGGPPPMDSLSHDQLRHWPSGSFVNMVPSTGIYDPNYTIKRGYSIGVYPGIEPNDRRDWVAYSPANITRGTLNAVPTPRLRNPQPGAVLSREQVAFSWTDNPHDRGWEIQTASDRKFSKHEVRERVKEPHYEPSRAMSLGDKYWRVRAFGPIGVSPFSGAGLVHIVKDRPMLRLEDRISYYIIPELWHLYQRKDTKLLCMEHCSSDLESSPYKWDSPHPEEELIYSAIHGSEYCARACVSMVNHCHGGNLSQDRIAFFDQIQWGTKGFLTIDNVLPLSWRENGLACGKSMCSSRLRVTLEWALDRSLLPSAVGSSVVWTGYSDTTPKPPFDSVRSWLDSDRPIIVELANADGPGHTVVISGYLSYLIAGDTVQALYVLDPGRKPPYLKGADTPWFDRFWVPKPYDSYTKMWTSTWLCPSKDRVPKARDDDSSVHEDYDKDGIMDFDELYRLHSDTDKVDTDYDGILDKDEIRGYVFGSKVNEADGNLIPDLDKDGDRKENDTDSDNDSLCDSLEDCNKNGRFDADYNESSCFDQTDRRDPDEPCLAPPKAPPSPSEDMPSVDSVHVAETGSPQPKPLHAIIMFDYSSSIKEPERKMAIRVCDSVLTTWLNESERPSMKVGLIYACDTPSFDETEATNTTLSDLTPDKIDQILTSLRARTAVSYSDSTVYTAPGNSMIRILGPGGFDAWSTVANSADRIVLMIGDGGQSRDGEKPLDTTFWWQLLEWGHVTGGVLGIYPLSASAPSNHWPQDSVRMHKWAGCLSAPDSKAIIVRDSITSELIDYVTALVTIKHKQPVSGLRDSEGGPTESEPTSSDGG